MPQKEPSVAKNVQCEIEFVKIKSIGKSNVLQDVYCLASENNGNMIANGIVTKNCDALRYAIASAFPRGEFYCPDEHLSIDEIRKQVYGDLRNPLDQGPGGYF